MLKIKKRWLHFWGQHDGYIIAQEGDMTKWGCTLCPYKMWTKTFSMTFSATDAPPNPTGEHQK